MKEININDIKPIGNFEFVLNEFYNLLNKANKNPNAKNYVSKLAKIFKLNAELGVTEVLEENLIKNPVECWDKKEAKICLLCMKLILIKTNNAAQSKLNNIKMSSEIDQLNEYIQTNEYAKKIFGKNFKVVA